MKTAYTHTHTQKKSTYNLYHHVHLLKRKAGGKAKREAQLRYLWTPRYFCVSKLGSSTTTARW